MFQFNGILQLNNLISIDILVLSIVLGILLLGILLRLQLLERLPLALLIGSQSPRRQESSSPRD